MGRPREPSVIVEVAGGRMEHPCPPDPARICTVIAGLADGLDWQRLAGAVWSYDPCDHPQTDPQPVEEGDGA